MTESRYTTLAALVTSFASRGDAEAILAFGIDSTVSLSYAALHAQITDVSAALEAKGIGPGDFVLLCGPNSPGWIAAYFGTVSLGAAAIPVDDQAGEQTLAAVLRHSGARFAFTTKRHIEELGDAAARLLGYALLDETADAPAPSTTDGGRPRPAAGASSEPSAPEPASIASLVYTSGTTGTPKAVPLTHANLVSNADALMQAGLIRSSDRVLLPLPLHHTYPFTVGLLLVLGMGATLVLPSGISGPDITGALKSGRATAMLGVPSLYAAIWQGIETRVQAGGARAAHLFHRLRSLSRHLTKLTGVRLGRLLFRPLHSRLGPHLRILGCGGAKLDPELAENLETLGWIVLSGYGLTETSPVLTFNSPKERRLDTEGRPIPGVEIKIGPSASPGAHGEILARGPNVFGGYWQNPEATRSAFTSDGWYRTGDLGWIDETGYLHVAGRLKEVIVLADGKNVFPEDVEPAYAASPLLREVALLERGGALVALVVPDEDELRRRGGLSAVRLLGDEIERRSMSLPKYQRVTDFRAVRTPLPRTRLGKLRRHLLPELYERAAQRSLEEQPTALTEEDERIVNASGTTRAVWEWLETRYPDRHLYLDMSPQLDLQIDSLGWVTLTLELEQRFHVSLPGSVVSRVLTLRDLLNEVHRAELSGTSLHDKPAALPLPAPPGPAVRAVGRGIYGFNRGLMRTAFKLHVVGAESLPRDRPLVLTPNHVSFLDPPAVAAALPPSILPRVYWAGWVGIMYAGPIRRFVSRAARVFPVDPDQDLAGAIGTARALLEQGSSLVWFPEGRRSPDGSLLPFRPGIGVLLKDQSCLVVPTYLQGTYEAWPITRRLPRIERVTVTFGRAVTVAELAAEGEGESEETRIRSALEQRVRDLSTDRIPESSAA